MTFMTAVRGAALAAAATLAGLTGARAADLPVLKLAVQVSGTVAWELDTIRHYGLDTENGFRLEVQDVAGSAAAQVALQGGTTDGIVSDWLWVARQRAEGRDYVFIPYSKAVGGLMVKADSPVHTLADLKGKKIGIAGGPVDKSWLILRAYARQKDGFDLAATTDQVFGAPPLIFRAALSGEVQGAINFWHFAAKMQAAGMRPVITVAQAAEALGLDPDTPLLGYVIRGQVVKAHPDLVAAFARASRAAKEKLATDPAAWDRLRDRMRVKNDAQFAALKEGWIAGIPARGAVDEAAAGKMLAVMATLGGKQLVGDLKGLPDGVFYAPGM